MNLIIDIGNTRAKVALFSCGELVESYIVEPLTREYIDELLAKYPLVSKAIVSSTRGNIDAIVSMLRHNANTYWQRLSYASYSRR